jgi:hypothetical protein
MAAAASKQFVIKVKEMKIETVHGYCSEFQMELERFPKMVQNWTSKIKILIRSDMPSKKTAK